MESALSYGASNWKEVKVYVGCGYKVMDKEMQSGSVP